MVASWRGSRFSTQSVLVVASRCRHRSDGVESQALGRKLPFDLVDFQRSECLLLVRADVQPGTPENATSE